MRGGRMKMKLADLPTKWELKKVIYPTNSRAECEHQDGRKEKHIKIEEAGNDKGSETVIAKISL